MNVSELAYLILEPGDEFELYCWDTNGNDGFNYHSKRARFYSIIPDPSGVLGPGTNKGVLPSAANLEITRIWNTVWLTLDGGHIINAFQRNIAISNIGSITSGCVLLEAETSDKSLFNPSSAEDLLIIRGTVDSNGDPFAGQGFLSSRFQKGVYDITFGSLPNHPSFSDYPSASVTQVFNGNSKSKRPLDLTAGDGTGGRPTDNAVIVWIKMVPQKNDRTITIMRVLTGNSQHGIFNVNDPISEPEDRPFSFIVMGPR